VVCLAVSIFAGFVPWFSQAHAALKLFQSQHIGGEITCNGSTFGAKVNFGGGDFPGGDRNIPLGLGDTGWIVISFPEEKRSNVGKIINVEVSSHSFKISAVIEKYTICDRLKTLVELSSFDDKHHDGFTCQFAHKIDIEYLAKGIGPGSEFEDTGRFSGSIKCIDVPTPIPGVCAGILCSGNSLEDIISGTSANNLIDGEGGNDILNGLAGNDKIIGGDGNDKMNGGDGKDFLIGGNGNDELTGGKGADLFQCGAGTDKITDFKPSEGDKKTSDCEQF
jgi:Ca2+-binding RTX toxin-like protein